MEALCIAIQYLRCNLYIGQQKKHMVAIKYVSMPVEIALYALMTIIKIVAKILPTLRERKVVASY